MRTRPSSISPATRLLAGVLAFKLNWLVLVLGQERWTGWAALLLAIQLCLGLQRPAALRMLIASLFVTGCGITLDYFLLRVGILQFADKAVPLWLCLLWFAFALVLLQMQPVLQRARFSVLVIAGALAGAVGYGAGAALGAVNFGIPPWIALVVIALAWCAALPLARWSFAAAGVARSATRFAALVVPVLVFATCLPARATTADAELLLLGEGTYSFLMLRLYTARLDVAAKPFSFPGNTPFRLTLHYHRAAKPQRVLEATLGEWKAQGVDAPESWIEMLRNALPPLAVDDELALDVNADYTALLLHNGKVIATFADPHFTRAFAGIWLAPNTSAPGLRRQLLGEKS